MMTKARKQAWARLQDHPDLEAAREADRLLRSSGRYQRRGANTQSNQAAQSALNLRNK